MVKLTNGRTTAYVSEEKAQKLASILGMRVVVDDSEPFVEETPEVVEAPKPRRGRPPKKAS